MDTVFVRNLTFQAIVGILPHERTTPQPITFNLEISTDFSTINRSHALQDGVDYAAVCEQVKARTLDLQPTLLEPFAETIADMINALPGVTSTLVEISKPEAVADAQAVGVRISRRAASP